jgi:hypothetical protein
LLNICQIKVTEQGVTKGVAQNELLLNKLASVGDYIIICRISNMPFLSLLVIKWRHNSQHNDTQHNGLNCDTQNNSINCRYAECRLTDKTACKSGL